MIRTLVISGMTLKRLWRSKLLIVTLVVALLIIGLMSSSLVMIEMATEAGEQEEARQAAGGMFFFVTMLMGWFADLVGLVTGVTVTRQEIKDGTIMSVLAKPISRGEYLVGNYLGTLVYLLLIWVVFAAIYVGLVYLTGQLLGSVHGLILLGHMMLSVLMLSLAFGLAQRFSAWVAAVFSLVIYNGDAVVAGIVDLLRLVKLNIPEWTSRAMSFPFPATDSLDTLFESLLRTPLEPLTLSWSFLHLVDYSIVMVLLGWWLFRRQDLNPMTE